MKMYSIRSGSLAAVAAAALMLSPATAFGQRGASSTSDDSPETVEQAEPAPQTTQRGQMHRGQMQDGARLTERERLERMREHMISGMRRMAVRMTAVQNRIRALERGEPDAAPPVMKMKGMQGMQRGNGMRMRDGGGMECKRAPSAAGESRKRVPSTGDNR